MSTTVRQPVRVASPGVPLLENGERMKQPEFHRRYEQQPGEARFELIGGTVYMASPARWHHGDYQGAIATLFGCYRARTPGVVGGTDVTVILGEESEPRPDAVLRIEKAHGGQARLNEDNYLVGPPELVAEISYSTRSLDMNQKRQDYLAAGIQEYLVVCVEEQEVHWFHFPSKTSIKPNRQGISRSRVFPGLWIDTQALLRRDYSRLVEVLQQGLAHREHSAFLRRLEKAKRS
jgi:Uma2 family endonuclease